MRSAYSAVRARTCDSAQMEAAEVERVSKAAAVQALLFSTSGQRALAADPRPIPRRTAPRGPGGRMRPNANEIAERRGWRERERERAEGPADTHTSIADSTLVDARPFSQTGVSVDISHTDGLASPLIQLRALRWRGAGSRPSVMLPHVLICGGASERAPV